VLFALHGDFDLRDTVDLRWREAEQVAEPMCKLIVDARPRHPRIDYVFWEELSNGVIAPLFGIHESLWSSTAGLSMEQLRGQFKRMTWVDPQADSAAFFAALSLALDPVPSPNHSGA